MSANHWREQLWRAAWNHPLGRAATFALPALTAAAGVHHGAHPNTAFEPWGPLIGSAGAWAVSLVKWPPRSET